MNLFHISSYITKCIHKTIIYIFRTHITHLTHQTSYILQRHSLLHTHSIAWVSHHTLLVSASQFEWFFTELSRVNIILTRVNLGTHLILTFYSTKLHIQAFILQTTTTTTKHGNSSRPMHIPPSQSLLTPKILK